MPDPSNPQLFLVYMTFSLEIRDQLTRGIIIPGMGVRCNNFDAACSSWIVSSAEEEDDDSFEDPDDYYFKDPDGDSFEDPGDSMDSPAAGSSPSPSALYATPTSFVKRPMSPAKEASVKRPYVQAGQLSFFTKAPK